MKALRERVPINLARPVERPERAQFARPERPERQERYERPYERGYGPSEPPVQAPPIPRPSLSPVVFDVAKDLRGTLEAVIFDEGGKELGRMPVSDLAEKLPGVENAHLVLFDGDLLRPPANRHPAKFLSCLVEYYCLKCSSQVLGNIEYYW